MSCDQKSFKNTALERADTERWVSRDGRKSPLWPAYRPWLILLLDEIKMRAEYSSPGVRGFSNPATKVMEQLWKWEAKLNNRLSCAVVRALELGKREFYSLLCQLTHCDLRLFTPFLFLSLSFLIYKDWNGGERWKQRAEYEFNSKVLGTFKKIVYLRASHHLWGWITFKNTFMWHFIYTVSYKKRTGHHKTLYFKTDDTTGGEKTADDKLIKFF